MSQEVTFILADDMVAFLKTLAETQLKIAAAAGHINAAAEALTKRGLKREDVAAIIASRAGVSRTAVEKIMAVMRQGNLDAYEVVAIYISDREKVSRQNVRIVITSLMKLVKEVQSRPVPEASP